ncbi:MAG: cytochrome c3 family protein [Thermodesulfobacteriota bacterium]
MRVWGLWVLTLTVLLLSLNGWASSPKAVEEAPAPEAEVRPMNLPCFGCHSQEAFESDQGFPHSLHRGMGVHCNQCHVVKAHESLTLNGGTCMGCHNLGKQKLSRTSMPARFNHEMHMGMFECQTCHGAGKFAMKSGGTRVTMAAINKGQLCGSCHNGRMASSPDNCGSCH